jgi:hypothetical protein
LAPYFFGQSFQEAFIGQIPFTGYHLLGNVALGALISPLIYRLVIKNPRFEISYIKQFFSHPLSDI